MILQLLQPAPDCLLDHDGGFPELVCPQLLQVGHLACPEENLGAAKLELVWILYEVGRKTHWLKNCAKHTCLSLPAELLAGLHVPPAPLPLC